MGEGSDRPKKLIICVERGRVDEDRAGCNSGWEGHVISKEHQGRWVGLWGDEGRMEGEFITVEMSVTNCMKDYEMRCTPDN